jgi:flagellin-like hook-associated protein FlgL
MVASAFAALAAITTGLQAQLRYAERLATATDCLGRLRALEVQASLGTLSQEDLAKSYAELVARYPEYT